MQETGKRLFVLFRKRHIEKKKNNLQILPDEDIIRMYLGSGDLKYVGELFERYTHLIFAVCMKYLKNEEDCKDAVMNIFEELVEKIKKHDISNFKSWIYSLTKNYCLMQIRRSGQFEKYKEQKMHILKGDIMESVNELHQYNTLNNEENIKTLKLAMESLNEHQNKCVQLFYLEEKSYNEVATITGYDIKKVKSYIQNGKRSLKIIMDRNNGWK